MQKLLTNRHAQMGMVGTAIGLFITLIIAILIYYNISAGVVQTAGTDNSYESQMANASINASTSISDQAATFFTIAPIIGIVIVAVVVIGYVQRIGG